jgi:hypothetical protein
MRPRSGVAPRLRPRDPRPYRVPYRIPYRIGEPKLAREERQTHVDRFAQPDFNEQLYNALKKSPWWMLSLALHAAVFAIGLMIKTAGPPPQTQPQIQAMTTNAEIPPEDLPETPEDTEEVHAQDVVVQEPVIKDAEVADHVETDNDLPYQESFGQSEGISDAPFEGPANNGLIGIGGGAGGAFKGRGGNRDLRTGGGGRKKQDDAVEHALKWLAAHQSPDGGWECAGFDKWCDGKPAEEGKRPDGLGKPMYDSGVTGLALLAFLGAGYTNRGDHPFAKTVSRGLHYLRNIQDPEGCFGPRTTQHFIYNHATSSLAMVEAYGMTESPIFKDPAQRALDFIALARNPYFAWRYGVKPGDNDTSVTGWMMMALKSAKIVDMDAKSRGKPEPLQIDHEAFDGIRTWLDKMTDKDYGRVGYLQQGSGPARPQDLVDKFPTDKSESMTAVGCLARIFIGEDPRKSDIIKKGANLMDKLLPTWNTTDGSIDMYYWYYATLAMFQIGGDHWKKWNDAMQTSIVTNQRLDTAYCQFKGSWDPIDPWGPDGGRVYSTSLLAMCLEVYYRYGQVFGTK